MLTEKTACAVKIRDTSLQQNAQRCNTKEYVWDTLQCYKATLKERGKTFTDLTLGRMKGKTQQLIVVGINCCFSLDGKRQERKRGKNMVMVRSI